MDYDVNPSFSGQSFWIGTEGADLFEIEGFYPPGEFVYVAGRSGNDVYYFADADYTDFLDTDYVHIVEGVNEGSDTIRVRVTDSNFQYSTISLENYDNVENLVVETPYGGEGVYLYGNDLANSISTDDDWENDIDGGAGADTMAGGDGDDDYWADDAGDRVTEGSGESSGYDRVYASVTHTLGTNVERLELISDAGNINGIGNAGDNDIYGNYGNNLLSGLAGDDYIDGDYAGGGDGGADTILGGAGNDELWGEGGNDRVLGDVGHDSLDGGEGNDTLDGGAGNDVLSGEGGADSIIGGDGDDEIMSWGPALGINAGGGNDTIWTVAGDAAPSVDGGAGNDTLFLSFEGNLAAYSMSGALENLVVNFSGEGIAITGNGLSNYIAGRMGSDTLRGGAGNDVLFGEGGEDELFGGAGNDTYIVAWEGGPTDTVTETAAGDGAADHVYTDFGYYALGDFVENLTYTGEGDNFVGRGNALNNLIVGSDGWNHLVGGAGNDTLDAMSGEGWLAGGEGNDVYLVRDDDIQVSELGGQGTDTVRATTTYSLGMNLENLVMLGNGSMSGYGNNAANNIAGTSGSDYIDGGRGNDTVSAGGGDDYIVVDSATDSVDGGAGNDTVVSMVSYTLTSATLENVELYWGGGDLNATGNASANSIHGNSGRNVLNGLDGNDSVYGGRGKDTLSGGAGNDSLDGGSGADSMAGGAGNDTYYVNQSNDMVTEAGGSGTDTVVSDVRSYTLGTGLDNLILSGEGIALNGTGNGDANAITGNGHNNLLRGMGGADTLDGGEGNNEDEADTLVGGAGNDTYLVSDTDDVLDETSDSGAGTDTVLVGSDYSGAYFLMPGFENVTLLEGFAYSAYGNSAANFMVGNSGGQYLWGGLDNDKLMGMAGDDELDGAEGNDSMSGGAGHDTLDGGTGSDTMDGGAGNDDYYVDSASDVVTDTLGGQDWVQSSVSFSLGTGLEDLTLVGSEGIGLTGTGNAVANFINGHDGANTLSGLGGNDTVVGFGGSDSISGGDGDDVVDGGSGSNTLSGGGGNDVYNVSSATDSIVADTGGTADIINLFYYDNFNAAAAGIEQVRHYESGDGSVTLGGGASNEIFRMLDLSRDAYTLDAGAGNDTLELWTDSSDTSSADSVNGGAGTADALTVEVWSGVSSEGSVSVSGVESVTFTGTGGLNFTEADNGVTAYTARDYSTGGGELFIDALGPDQTVDLTVRDSSDIALSTGEGVGTLILRSAAAGDTNGNEVTLLGMAEGGVARVTGDENLYLGLTDGADNVTLERFNANWIQFQRENDSVSGGSFSAILDDVNTQVWIEDFDNATLMFDDGADADTVLGNSQIDLWFSGEGTLEVTGAADDVAIRVMDAGEGIDASEFDGDNLLIENASSGSLSIEANQLNTRILGGIYNEYIDFGDRLHHNDVVIDDSWGGDNDELYADMSGFTAATGNTFQISGIEFIYFDAGTATASFLNAAGIDGATTIYLEGGNADSVPGGGGTWTITNLGVDLDATDSNLAVNVELTGDNGQDVDGSAYNDTITGSEYGDYIEADSGADSLVGGDGNDQFLGGNGNDAVSGGGGNDTLYGEDGNDNVAGGEDDDWLFGGADNDSLSADAGDDYAEGGAGNDTVSGGDGQDTLWGDGGADSLSGGAGNDSLYGADGADSVAGGDGADHFWFDDAGDVDTIVDFDGDEGDELRFDGDAFGFGGEGFSGYLSSKFTTTGDIDTFVNGGNQYLIYETGSGELYYDADAAGIGSTPTLIATLTGAPTLTASDIYYNAPI